MKINFNTETLAPMLAWLKEYKTTGKRDERKLRSILSMPDYGIEFARYGNSNLPVCGINFEEAVDFFMHFDDKDFENPRLQYKKPYFMAFFDDLESRLKKLEMFQHLTQDDCARIESLLSASLPEKVVGKMEDITIILIVSMGNSMGWPYQSYVDYDVANLHLFETLDDFLRLTAHEIHHLFVGQMLGQEGVSPEGFFLQNFAYEGLAVHFHNNLGTKYKAKKYPWSTCMMDESDMAFYEAHFDEIFRKIQADYQRAKTMSLEEVSDMVSNEYETFEYMGKKISQFPTYYFGCYLWGLIDLHYGKEVLFETLQDPKRFVSLYNKIAPKGYQFDE